MIARKTFYFFVELVFFLTNRTLLGSICIIHKQTTTTTTTTTTNTA